MSDFILLSKEKAKIVFDKETITIKVSDEINNSFNDYGNNQIELFEFGLSENRKNESYYIKNSTLKDEQFSSECLSKQKFLNDDYIALRLGDIFKVTIDEYCIKFTLDITVERYE